MRYATNSVCSLITEDITLAQSGAFNRNIYIAELELTWEPESQQSHHSHSQVTFCGKCSQTLWRAKAAFSSRAAWY